MPSSTGHDVKTEKMYATLIPFKEEKRKIHENKQPNEIFVPVVVDASVVGTAKLENIYR